MLLQFKVNHDEFDIIHYNGDKIRRFRKYEHYNTNNNYVVYEKKHINDIIIYSGELKGNSHIYMIFLLIFCWICVKIYELFI